MTVEKISNMAAHGSSNAKNGGGIKGAHGTENASDANDPGSAFGALLSSLGVAEVEPTVAINAVLSAPNDQPRGDTSSDGCALIAFTPIVQVTLPPVTAASTNEIATGGTQVTLLAVQGTPSTDGVELTVADAPSPVVLPGTTQVFRSSGQSDLVQVPEAIGPGDVGTKASRTLRPRGQTENASVVTTVTTQSANAVDISGLDAHVVAKNTESLGRVIGITTTDVLPLEVGQQTEFRRDKTIFKVNSATAGADVSATNGPDAKNVNLSLEGKAPAGGSGMTQGDQNPGTYWMSRDMKNAQMKLDGFGESPVEVSISVHGNQTHVAFRTDEAQTRLALENAGATLKDMLSREGLNLAGVSVGTSGSGGQAAQDPRSRREGRTSLLGNLADKFPSSTSDHLVTSRVGQLDVFV